MNTLDKLGALLAEHQETQHWTSKAALAEALVNAAPALIERIRAQDECIAFLTGHADQSSANGVRILKRCDASIAALTKELP